jgi:DNA helicase HerA-like ATPase
MKQFFERLSLVLWNSLFGRRRLPAITTPGLIVGFRVVDEAVTSVKLAIPLQRRAMHLALLGRTGTGKSSLLRWFCEQDIRSRRGFLVFDIHGELTPALLSIIAAEERRLKSDLSEQVIVSSPPTQSSRSG